MKGGEHLPGEDDRARLERLASIFEHSTDAIIGKTLEGEITDWNPAAERTYGWTVAEAVGRNIEIIFPPKRKKELVGILERLRRGEETGPHETERMRKDGRVFPALVTVSPIRDRTGAVIAGSKTSLDLSDIRRRERAEAAALVLRDEFLGSISHDLQQPLTTIRGQAQLLLRRIESGTGDLPRLTSGLKAIIDSVSRVSTRVAALVDEVREESGRPPALDRSPTDLVTLAREVVEEYRLAGEAHEIVFVCDLPALSGEFDAARLRRVLSNLLSNALKYSPAGGEVTVSLACEQDRRGAQAIVSVRDRGIGIPEAELPRIFDRHYRGTTAAGLAQGTGLGLADARLVVERHGGSLEVESRAGEGSSFTLRLPL